MGCAVRLAPLEEIIHDGRDDRGQWCQVAAHWGVVRRSRWQCPEIGSTLDHRHASQYSERGPVGVNSFPQGRKAHGFG